MAITDKTIQEFRDVVKEEYGTEMSQEEASETLSQLVGYFNLLHKIDTREKTKKQE